MIYIFIFLFGLITGSFLNVVIVRVPEGKSFIFSRSQCPKCGNELQLADLIPVASFLLLKGKCRDCSQKISLRYPLVEMLTAAMFLLAFFKLGVSVKLLEAYIFICLSITVAFTDLIYLRIPNKIVIFGSIAAIPFIVFSGSYIQALEGALIGGGFLFLLAILSRGNMGGGDIKLAAMQGLYIGFINIGLTLFFAFISAGVISIVLILLKIKNRKDAIPFGPFLALAGLLVYFFGSEIIQWYIGRFF